MNQQAYGITLVRDLAQIFGEQSLGCRFGDQFR